MICMLLALDVAGFELTVGGNVLEASVRVDDQKSTENGISDRVQRASGEWCHGQRNEAGCDKSTQLLAWTRFTYIRKNSVCAIIQHKHASYI